MTTYTPIVKTYTPKSFLEEMNKKRKDIYPEFADQFDKYTKKVYSLLSENISVVTSRVVATAINEENYRVINALSKTWEKAEKFSQILSQEAYNQVRNHKKPANNMNYEPMDLEAV